LVALSLLVRLRPFEAVGELVPDFLVLEHYLLQGIEGNDNRIDLTELAQLEQLHGRDASGIP